MTRDGAPAGGAAAQPRRLAVLAVVARAGDRGVKRERLLTLLWPDADEETGRAAISQALHLLRRDLGSDELFLGVQDLRLNQAVATCDVLEFEAAMASGDLGRAAMAYAGPFLEGFRVPGARELDRWIEEERTGLAQKNAELLERMARAEMARGDAAKAASWWRRRAALDPLNARVTVELMKALDAGGERAAAIRQAGIYEALLKQEMALEPDGAVLRLAAELRARSDGARGLAAPDRADPSVQPTDPPPTAPPTDRTPRARSTARRRSLLAIAAMVILAALLHLRASPDPPDPPRLAIGTIRDYRDGAEGTGLVTDMLATNLARIPGIQVVSTLRMLELLGRQKGEPSVAAAARAGGATELMEGAIHGSKGGALVLELRRVALATGTVQSAVRVEAESVVELVNRATREVASDLGLPGGGLARAQVSTGSGIAYRFYERGLRAFARGEAASAREMFDAALAEDSTFAMAAYYRYYLGGTTTGHTDPGERVRLARLAAQAPERERLLIQGHLAIAGQEAGILAIAETLAVRYPMELDGHFLLGYSRMTRGEFALAIPHLQRVLELDSTGFGTGSARCLVCEALSQLTFAWHAVDSLGEALRLAREWVARDSSSLRAWGELARLAVAAGLDDEAVAAWARGSGSGHAYEDVLPATLHVVHGRFPEAERAFRAGMTSANPAKASEALWYLAITLRHQGRWEESARLMRQRSTRYSALERAGDFDFLPKTAEALARYEGGDHREAIRIWDSLAVRPHPALLEGARNRRQVFLYTLLTDAAFAAGDTSSVRRYADSASAWAARSHNPRDRQVSHHAHGVRLLAQGDTAQAIEALRRAIFSPTLGFTRTNLVLGRILNATGRHGEAITVLRPALRGSLESANLYVTHTDLHDQLARAFTALGQRDRARPHADYVARARRPGSSRGG